MIFHKFSYKTFSYFTPKNCRINKAVKNIFEDSANNQNNNSRSQNIEYIEPVSVHKKYIFLEINAANYVNCYS